MFKNFRRNCISSQSKIKKKKKQGRKVAVGPKLAEIRTVKQYEAGKLMCIGLFFFSDHCIKQIDSMLRRVCSSSVGRVHFFVLPYFYVICDLYHLEDKFKLEMGLKLEYTSWSRDSFFSLGLIMASLSCTDTLAVSIDMLIVLVKTGNKTSMQSFIIDAGRGSQIQVLRQQELIKLSTWSSVLLSNSVS